MAPDGRGRLGQVGETFACGELIGWFLADGAPLRVVATEEGEPSIVFVLDATGSMMASFDSLRMQLRKAVQNAGSMAKDVEAFEQRKAPEAAKAWTGRVQQLAPGPEVRGRPAILGVVSPPPIPK